MPTIYIDTNNDHSAPELAAQPLLIRKNDSVIFIEEKNKGQVDYVLYLNPNENDIRGNLQYSKDHAVRTTFTTPSIDIAKTVFDHLNEALKSLDVLAGVGIDYDPDENALHFGWTNYEQAQRFTPLSAKDIEDAILNF